MDDEHIKRRIGANIAFHRKQAGMTQLGLAEKLNYSDKAVSKWERGDSVPDVLTLMQLAEQFGITVNDLLVDMDALPDSPSSLELAMSQVSEKALKRKANKNVILALCTTLVWFVALFFFVILYAFRIPFCWIPFIYAVLANAIVLLSLRSAWHDFRWNKALISAIAWSGLASIYVSIWAFLGWNIPMLFLLGIPGQIAVFLWFRMFRPVKSKEVPDE